VRTLSLDSSWGYHYVVRHLRGKVIEIDMAGSVVVITGASGGIGSGIVARFARAGASLVLQHHRRPAPSATADGATTVQLDLTSPHSAGELIARAIERFGRVDALINNAGVQPVAGFAAISDEQWSEVIDTNVSACHRLTQAFARHVLERGGDGSVVHIASIEGTQPAPGHAHYSVSKAALIMHAKAAALELGASGVRVNAVSPGLIHREGLEDAWPEGVGRWKEKTPLRRLGQPTDVGDACVFLCSPMASWITGINLVVDGGVSARSTW
jgi:NAD(P)-dependent dehydrogenase (short-subunit alcohol dehydrogenase family)